jgi:hypothetical protein
VKNKIGANRILVGEFGVFRTNPGAMSYFEDLVSLFKAKRWHWAFYSFREDTWPGMDYELGTGKEGVGYWQAIGEGRLPGPEVYKANPFSDLLHRVLAQ